MIGLILISLLLHTLLYAQNVSVEIDPNAALVTEQMAEVEEATKYLEVKKVLAHDIDKQQFEFTRIRKVITDPKSMNNSVVDQYRDIIKRAVRLSKAYKKLQENATTAAEPEAESVPSDEHTFSHTEFPGYDNSASSVLLMVDNPKTLVQRKQLSSLCYMHAPAVVQYYGIWNTKLKVNSSATSDHGMIDITKEIASYFKGEELYRHVFDDWGGSSSDFLSRILHANATYKSCYPDSPIYDLKDALRTYGPALASGFMVYQDFKNTSVHHYHGLPDKTNPVGNHAMVLVGIRIDDGGNVYYLLQNWWPGKQFVELSRDYMLATGTINRPQFHFITSPQHSVPVERHTHSSRMHYAETLEAIEHAERLPLEWSLPPPY